MHLINCGCLFTEKLVVVVVAGTATASAVVYYNKGREKKRKEKSSRLLNFIITLLEKQGDDDDDDDQKVVKKLFTKWGWSDNGERGKRDEDCRQPQPVPCRERKNSLLLSPFRVSAAVIKWKTWIKLLQRRFPEERRWLSRVVKPKKKGKKEKKRFFFFFFKKN